MPHHLHLERSESQRRVGSRPDYHPGRLLLKLERDLHVDLVAYYVAIFDHDVHVLNPRALYAPQGLGGSHYGLVDGVLETLLRDGAQFRDSRDAHAFSCLPNTSLLIQWPSVQDLYCARPLAAPFLSLALPSRWSERPSAFFSPSPLREPPASFRRPLALSIAPSALSWVLFLGSVALPT